MIVWLTMYSPDDNNSLAIAWLHIGQRTEDSCPSERSDDSETIRINTVMQFKALKFGENF